MSLLNRVSIVAVLLLTVAPLTAQQFTLPTSPRLVEIVRLAQDGHGDSARTAIDDLLGRTVPGDPLYPEALYTAATVARSGDDSRLLFSRIVVEHGTSSWADRALLRLTQLDYGTGDTEAAMTRVRRLMTDYPASAVIPAAALWGARAAFERRDAAQACQWLERGIAAVGADVELRNQLEFTQQRCTNPSAAQPVASPVERVVPPTRNVTSPAATQSAPARSGDWRVQVAAISDPASIRRVEQQITRAGFTAFKVPGPGNLTKLQAGPFPSRDAAAAEVAALRAVVGGQPFVVRVE